VYRYLDSVVEYFLMGHLRKVPDNILWQELAEVARLDL
jgi:hypothetical protein